MKQFSRQKRLRCPSCYRKSMQEVQHERVTLDVCRKCTGLWFDDSELQKSVGKKNQIIQNESVFENDDTRDRGATEMICPHDLENLHQHLYSEKMKLTYQKCPKCNGIWLSREQFHLIQHAEESLEQRGEIDRELNFKDRLFQFFTNLPVEFYVRPKRPPSITVLLIVINLVVFLISIFAGIQRFVLDHGFVPARLEASDFFWAMFLHAGIVHLAGNMYILYKLGDNVEDIFGHRNFLIFYVFCGVASFFAQYLSDPNSFIPVLGASGAVSGVMGAYLVLFRRAKISFMLLFFQWKVSAFFWLAVWLAFNIAGILLHTKGIAWFAHVGGFLAGYVWTKYHYREFLRDNPMLRLLNNYHK